MTDSAISLVFADPKVVNRLQNRHDEMLVSRHALPREGGCMFSGFHAEIVSERVTLVMEQTRGILCACICTLSSNRGVWAFLRVSAVKGRIRLGLGTAT